MKGKNDNSDNLSNIDKRYELLHAARECSFDSYLEVVDYKQPILIKEINRTFRLHDTEQNLRVYFYLLALIDTFKVMLNTVRGDDRVVFGGINYEDIRALIDADTDEEQIIYPNTEIGRLFLAIIFHATAIRDRFPDYTLHPYVQIILDENIDQIVASIEQNLTIRVNQFTFIPEAERNLFVHDFIVKAIFVAGKVEGLFFDFIEKLNSSVVKNKKDVFDKKGDRSVKSLNGFVDCVKKTENGINFLFKLSLFHSDDVQETSIDNINYLCVDRFNRSISDLDAKLRKNKKWRVPTKVFHILKSSKIFGLYTDSYFSISFSDNGIPFSKEQVALWCASNSIFSDFFKNRSIHGDFQKISDHFNSITSKGVNLDVFLKDIRSFYKNKIKGMSSEELVGMLSIESIKDKEGFMLLQQNFEICAFIDDVKSMWSDIVADNLQSKLMLHEEFEDIHPKCAGVVLFKDVFKVKNGSVEKLTQTFKWESKRESTVLEKTKNDAAFDLMVRLFHLQPFFNDKAESRNVYENNMKFSTSTEDLFGATTQRLIAELKFLKLNLKVGDKKLDEIRTVNYKKTKKTQDPEAT